jgi:hypothetical protein
LADSIDKYNDLELRLTEEIEESQAELERL